MPEKTLPKGVNVSKTMTEQRLKLDNGKIFSFKGRPLNETGWQDEDGMQVRQELYENKDGEIICYINRVLKKSGRDEHTRKVYRLKVDGDQCAINDGKTEMTLSLDLLRLVVRGLCGMRDEAVPSVDAVDELLRVANS